MYISSPPPLSFVAGWGHYETLNPKPKVQELSRVQGLRALGVRVWGGVPGAWSLVKHSRKKGSGFRVVLGHTVYKMIAQGLDGNSGAAQCLMPPELSKKQLVHQTGRLCLSSVLPLRQLAA